MVFHYVWFYTRLHLKHLAPIFKSFMCVHIVLGVQAVPVHRIHRYVERFIVKLYENR